MAWISGLVGGATAGLGGLLSGKSATGSGSSYTSTSNPYYPFVKTGSDGTQTAYNPTGDLYQMIMDRLTNPTPLANISYGGITKPLYDTVAMNNTNTQASLVASILEKLLGVSSSDASGSGASSGWLSDALLGGANGVNSGSNWLSKLFGNTNSGSTSSSGNSYIPNPLS